MCSLERENNMNKLFTKISALVLGLTMSIGVGVAVGNIKKVETSATNYVYSGSDHDYGDWSYATVANGGTAPTSTRTYAKNKISFSSASKYFESVIFNFKLNANNKGKYPDSATTTSGTISGYPTSTGSNKTFTVTPAENCSEFDVILGGTAGNIEISSFDVTFSTSGSGTTVNKTITGPSDMSKNVGDSSVDIASQIKVDGNVLSGCSVASSNTDAVTVSGTTLSFVGAGTSTITISHANTTIDTTTYVYANATFTVTVSVVKTALPTMASGNYGKITSSTNLSDGYYLLVCESGNLVFNGAASSLDSNTGSSVLISNDYISSTSEIDACALYIASNGKTDGYSVAAKVKYENNGYKYIGRAANSNGIDESDSVLDNTITFDSDGHVLIDGTGGRRLCAYNNTTFRYYSSTGNAKNLFLYKKGYTPTVSYTVTYADGDADSGTVPTDNNSPYEAGDTVTVLGNTGNLTKSGYIFGGWNDGTTTRQPESTFEMPSENVTLTAVWTAVTLTSVAIEGDMSNKEYWVGDSWDFTGLKVEGYYNNESHETLSTDLAASVESGDLIFDLDNASPTVTSITTLTFSNIAWGDQMVGGESVTISSIVVHAAATATGVTVSGDMTKKSYTVGDSWDYSGLNVTVTYNNNKPSSTKTLTAAIEALEIEFDVTPASPAADTTSVTLSNFEHIEYNGEIESVTITGITVSTYTNTPNLTPGKYYIKCGDNYFTGTQDKGVGGSTTTKPDTADSKFTFQLVGNDTWNVVNDSGLYLSWTDTTKGISLSDTAYNITVESGTNNGTYKLKSQSNTRYFSQYDSGPDFRCYNSGQSGATFDLTLETTKTVSSFTVYQTGANKNVLKGTNFNAAAAAAAGFQARLNYSDSTFDNVTALATWTLDTSTVGTATLTVTYLTYAAVTINDMNIVAITLDHLVLDVTEAKTSYYQGDTLNTDNIIITGVDSNNNNYSIGLSDVTFSPTTLSTVGTQQITVTYTNPDESAATGTYDVSVAEFTGYLKVTQLSDLTVGDSYVVASPSNSYLMGSITGTNKYINAVDGSNDYFSSDKQRLNVDLPTGTTIVTLLYAGNNSFYIYDISNSKYLQLSGSGSDSYYRTSLSEASVFNVSFTNGQISLTINGSSRVLGFNNGTNPKRFASYAEGTTYNTIALYKLSGSTIKTSLNTFANDSLKMNDSAYSGDISTANCASNYSAMKTAYSNLTDAEKNIFQYSDDYSAARLRLNNWAKANGETFTYGNDTPFAASKNSIMNIISNGNTNSTIIIIVTMISLSALGGYFFIRRRREH